MGRMTDQQRSEYREAKRKAAEQQLDELLSRDGFETWLKLRRTVHTFSWTNQILIAVQAHELGVEPVAVQSATRWKRAGYHPAKGSRGLYIWTFRSRRRKDRSWKCCDTVLRDERQCETCGRRDHYFRLAPVFAAEQVVSFETGEPPVIERPACEPIDGDQPGAALLDGLASWAVEQGIASSVDLHAKSRHGEGGWYRPSDRKIAVVDDGRSANSRLRTLIHEIAHALGIGTPDDTLSYSDAEVAVECVSYIVASTAGLDTSGESIPYMAGWGGEDARERVRALAERIDAAAKRIETAIAELHEVEPAWQPA